MDLNPDAFAPSAQRPFIPNTDLTEQLKIYGEDDATVSLSIVAVGDSPDKFGVAVDAGALVTL